MPAVVFCPCPPLLVPALGRGTEAALTRLRAACGEALGALADSTRVVVLGAGSAPQPADETAGGTWAGYGVDLPVGGPRPGLDGDLLVGAWLLDDLGHRGPRRYRAVGADTALAPPSDGDGWLVVGDGSARRSRSAPGYLDERAEAYDDAVAQALATGDAQRLAALDPQLASELWCGGSPAWRAVGRTLLEVEVAEARLVAHEAPYGVGYLVATWSVAGPGSGSGPSDPRG